MPAIVGVADIVLARGVEDREFVSGTDMPPSADRGSSTVARSHSRHDVRAPACEPPGHVRLELEIVC